MFITTKTLSPGKPGTKNEFEKYGKNLVYVRYKYDAENKRKIKTIELVFEDKPWNKNLDRKPFNKKVFIKIEYDEKRLQKVIRSVGGSWDKGKKLWKIFYGDVVNLGLEDRIAEL